MRGPAAVPAAAADPRERRASPPRLIEVAGPAGAGKSTLARRLCAGSRGPMPGPEPTRAANPLLYLRQGAALAPSLLRIRAAGRGCTRDEVRQLVYLRGWRGELERLAQRTPGGLVLDQGPVFRLATLLGLGPAALRDTGFADWWRQAIRSWGTALDAVVWLDAQDDVLIRRIRERQKPHAIREADLPRAREYLATYRSAYEWVLARLRDVGVEVLRFDTSRESPEGLAARVSARLGLADRAS